MDHFIAVHNFLYKVLSLFFVHAPDFLRFGVICLLEPLELLLEIFELRSEIFVGFGQTDVNLLVVLLLLNELGLLSSHSFHDFTLPLLEVFLRLLVDLLPLPEDRKVKGQFLVVKLENSLHVLHTFL